MDSILSLLTKLLSFKIAGLIFLFNIGIYSVESVDFCKNNKKHILCPDYKPSEELEKCEKGFIVHMTGTEKNSFVDTINEIRNGIAKGHFKAKTDNENLPQSAGMTVTQWDNTLELAARRRIQYCPFKKLNSELTEFGQFQAHSRSATIMITDDMENVVSSFMEGFAVNKEWLKRILPLLAHRSLLFIGCVGRTYGPHSKEYLDVVCFFVYSKEAEKPGSLSCSDCPFSHVGFKCSTKYKSLCDRPKWGISDDRTQKASYLDGFIKRMTTTTTASTTASTTTIIFFGFLVQHIYCGIY